MIEHIIDIAKYSIGKSFSETGNRDLELFSELLDGLEVNNFPPENRAPFLMAKHFFKVRLKASETNGMPIIGEEKEKYLKNLIEHLKTYGDAGSIISRDFSFMHNSNLKRIVERDYKELTVKTFPSGAWKSTVILAGSLLETMLFDALTNPTWINIALNSSKAPSTNRTVLENGGAGWTLEKLINVATNINLLPRNRTSAIDQITRKYRNYVHPMKEIREEHSITEAEAWLAKGAVELVINSLGERIVR